ncbi:alpha-hydroxy-acid oxidizing enzyme [Deinococcus piscis]|uniref:Alpha-hydroxy-acid oxidizing enzyme n=1 Tax=Deinococcus piscis TaxID=394230 RepID=A0ABQ3K423_9DEIO|nr:alpha-hydroxy acid oxidase [Deinococcus piscis]GHG02158.1 alpha-hydroxy-acid oxidizing enzyme [Deinococcus piscis]
MEHPTDCLNLRELELLGRQRLADSAHPSVVDYYLGGAGDERTLRGNREAWAEWRLRPRMLVDITEVDTSASVLGLTLSSPVGIAPSAMHGLAHPEGECATAAAAAEAGSLMTLSTLSTRTLEDVAAAAQGRWWFQLYLYRDREVSRALVQRAEAAGARALVLTVDAPLVGRREALLRRPLQLPPDLPLPNVGPRTPGTESLTHMQYFDSLLDTALTWRDLEWLQGITRLPLVLKGILTAEDAALAREHGAHIWVSNHGGRQLDGAVTAPEVLGEVVAAAGDREVYVDGGVTRGGDVLRALALGARAVFLGRAALWGLAAGGQAGVAHTLKLLHEELALDMALCGKTALDQLGPDLLHRR